MENGLVERRIRLAVVGESPCHLCHAACCKQKGHEYAVLLRGDEVRRFAAFAVQVPVEAEGTRVVEWVLPYRAGRCQFLDGGDRCLIYEDRPGACREFQCSGAFNAQGVGRHGRFLDLNPEVARILEGW
jgi:Fe-S-cluster containining protein